MHDSEQITFQLRYLQDQKILTLRWCSFQCIVHSLFAAIDNSIHNYANILVAFPTDLDSALGQSLAQ